MLTVLRLLALRWLAARTFGGLLATLALLAVPLAAVLKLVGIPLLVVLGVVAAPVIAVLALIGLPALLVGGTVMALLVGLAGLLMLGVLVLKVALLVALVVWLVRAVVRLVRRSGGPPPPRADAPARGADHAARRRDDLTPSDRVRRRVGAAHPVLRSPCATPLSVAASASPACARRRSPRARRARGRAARSCSSESGSTYGLRSAIVARSTGWSSSSVSPPRTRSTHSTVRANSASSRASSAASAPRRAT
jgi:hypothetical protein